MRGNNEIEVRHDSRRNRVAAELFLSQVVADFRAGWRPCTSSKLVSLNASFNKNYYNKMLGSSAVSDITRLSSDFFYFPFEFRSRQSRETTKSAQELKMTLCN